jgi:uncharacterized membrane protein
MNTKYMVIVAALAVMMVGASALVTDDAFADKKRHDDKKKSYGKSQAVAQDNYCGNGDWPMNVGCQNTASQIQGEGNAVALESEQEFEESNEPMTGAVEEAQ